MAISGKPLGEDVLRDSELAKMAELQAQAWEAERVAQLYGAEIRTRIMHGARIESLNWEWDSRLQMVRSKRKGTG